MEITRAQLKSLPDWLRTFDHLAEDGATPLTKRDWLKARNKFLGIEAPKKKQSAMDSSIPTSVFNDSAELMQQLLIGYADELSKETIDRTRKLLAVTVAVIERRAEISEGRSARMKKLHAEGKINPQQGGAPKKRYRCIDGNGHVTIVEGMRAAEALTGYKNISVRMSQARRYTGEDRVTLGYVTRPETMWVVDLIGTDPASSQEPCQKPENDGQRENG